MMIVVIKKSEGGRPHEMDTRSVRFRVRREHLPPREMLGEMHRTGYIFHAPVKDQGEWWSLSGPILEIEDYDEGTLVTLDTWDESEQLNSLCCNWERAPMWIPHKKSEPAGVLADWKAKPFRQSGYGGYAAGYGSWRDAVDTTSVLGCSFHRR